jgi:hypothetical protein
MKKDNLVKLAQQVLTEIDEEMLDERDNYLRCVLLTKLKKVFGDARQQLYSRPENNITTRNAYEAVKPILDDALQSYKDNK